MSAPPSDSTDGVVDSANHGTPSMFGPGVLRSTVGPGAGRLRMYQRLKRLLKQVLPK